MNTSSPKTKRKHATKTVRNEEPHVRTLIISGTYSVQFHPDGRRSALLEGRPWIPLDRNTFVWDLVDLILAKEANHEPNCVVGP